VKHPIIAFSDQWYIKLWNNQGVWWEVSGLQIMSSVTNITINVAKIVNAFDIDGFANPLSAHVGYTNDERVIALIPMDRQSKHLTAY